MKKLNKKQIAAMFWFVALCGALMSCPNGTTDKKPDPPTPPTPGGLGNVTSVTINRAASTNLAFIFDATSVKYCRRRAL